MSFCTAINCMDGRTQIPVVKFLQNRFGCLYVDMITEPGPNKILAEQSDSLQAKSIFDRVDISLKNHGSRQIAVAGHYDCAGNPAKRHAQELHTRQAVNTLRSRYDGIEVIGLWVNELWRVNELTQPFSASRRPDEYPDLCAG